MSKSSQSEAPKPLTPVELELMQIVWRHDEVSVADVLEALPPERKLAYTSVSTVLRILEQKGVLRSRKEGRGHLYSALLPREAYELQSVRHLVETVFDGTPSALVERLVEAVPLSPEEVEQIRKLLAKKGSRS
ncbi:Transcriptional regulator, MecI family [Cystobacter fuscus DSM 2262]|uniref:Transcriptional regulator, MecI family n=1 Tax=Cystobacter fuscus (strain ATCC 25194 / DSM 2262 / NBRC 100088 / M29) TaxID=1242864 RepID=S9NZL2_CYSF2|nr:BlaI/MecI/CopY family transcriptional regulator [Cystobacter fuscus]EPX55467.1 Transcriptional regulator, MecI family [Cystobacter fuscus DSM 2262]